MTSRRGAMLGGAFATCVALACVGGCASSTPETKTPPPQPKDDFQGFGALRSESHAAKKAGADDAAGEGAKDGKEEKADAKGGGDDGGEKTALNKEQVLTAIATAEKRFDACYKKYKDPGIYILKITIDPDGSCQAEPMRAPTRKEEPDLWTDAPAELDGGKNPKSPSNRCLATAMGQVKFPAFQGKALVVTYPLPLPLTK
jgi:hypothetical protein